MCRAFRSCAVAVAVFAFAGTADAGWVTIKNDTTKTLVLQDTTVAADGTIKRGTAIRLLPGETVREFRATPGVKSVVVCDSTHPGVALFRGDLKCADENQTFSITCDTKATCVKPVAPPVTLAKK